MPSRADIDPTEIPRLLPNLLISEHVADAGVGRWRYRLAGTAALGRNPTGNCVDELTKGDYRVFIERIHRIVREEQRALFCASGLSRHRDVGEAPAAAAHHGRPSDELDQTEGTPKHAGPVLADA